MQTGEVDLEGFLTEIPQIFLMDSIFLAQNHTIKSHNSSASCWWFDLCLVALDFESFRMLFFFLFDF